jgi:hypothetical protein
VGTVQMMQEVGGLTGRILLALLAVRIVSRRRLLRVFQIPALAVTPLVFVLAATADLQMVKWAIFGAGVLTVAQFSFWGNYLPRVFPTHLRGTGESFAANVGGRMIGTSAALATTHLATIMPGADPVTQLTYAAALVGSASCAIGFGTSFLLREPSAGKLPD